MHCRGCKLLTVGILSCETLILYDSVGTQKSPQKGGHTQGLAQGHTLGVHKGTHPRDTPWGYTRGHTLGTHFACGHAV